MRRPELVAMWLLALALRVLQIAFEPAYLHPDALFQGLEPAFRAVYGHGVVAWEFKEGLRSWSWPGLLAAPFAVLNLLGVSGPGQGMAWSVAFARSIPALIDLACMALAMGLVRQRAGPISVRVVGWVAACHPAWVIMAAQPLVDVPAAALLLALISLARPERRAGERINRSEGPPDAAPPHALRTHDPLEAPDWLHASALGAVAAITVLFRVQLAPAVFGLGVLWLVHHRAGLRTAPVPWLTRPLVGFVVAAALWGGLDWLTWGAPWHTLRAYLTYNLQQGQTAFGTMAADAYWTQFGQAAPGLRWASLPLLLVGARRAPWLAVALLGVVLPHQWVPYKVWRFLHPALWLWLCLAAIGLDALVDHISRAWRTRRPPATAVRSAPQGSTTLLATILGCVLVCGVAWQDGGVWRTTWLFHQGGAEAVRRSRGLNRAALAASELSEVRRVLQAVLPEAAAPGHALLGHDVEVLHALGKRVDRSALLDRDTWFVVDGPLGRTHPERPRLLRDWASGVALFQLEEILTQNILNGRSDTKTGSPPKTANSPKIQAPSAPSSP